MLTKESVQETINPHLPVGNVNGDEHSGVEIDIPDLSDGGQIVYMIRDGDGTSLCVDVWGRSVLETVQESTRGL